MSFVKPAALLLCVALAGCAGKSDGDAISSKENGGKPGVALKTAEPDRSKVSAEKEKQKGSWWSFGDKERDAGQAAAPKRSEVATVSADWLDEHEKRLRAAVAGSKFEVERRGDVLVVVAPVDPSFNKDRPHMLMPITLGPLSRVAKLVGGDPLNAVLVLGHADSSGDSALNRKLSLERAQAVAAMFRMSGFKGDRLALRGLGSDKPRATNDSATGRAQNRRVEMLVTRRDSLSALLAQNGR
jgi:outer membrane protein OmpA-like peptidoglycan-associated protein